MWWLLLRAILIGVICACALPDNSSFMSKLVRKRETQLRYCGSRLTDILRTVCQSHYYQGLHYKRKRDTNFVYSTPQDVDAVLWINPEAEEEITNTNFPFLPRSAANTLTNKPFRRQQRDQNGVADECCIRKGCTISELAEYCADR